MKITSSSTVVPGFVWSPKPKALGPEIQTHNPKNSYTSTGLNDSEGCGGLLYNIVFLRNNIGNCYGPYSKVLDPDEAHILYKSLMMIPSRPGHSYKPKKGFAENIKKEQLREALAKEML